MHIDKIEKIQVNSGNGETKIVSDEENEQLSVFNTIEKEVGGAAETIAQIGALAKLPSDSSKTTDQHKVEVDTDSAIERIRDILEGKVSGDVSKEETTAAEKIREILSGTLPVNGIKNEDLAEKLKEILSGTLHVTKKEDAAEILSDILSGTVSKDDIINKLNDVRNKKLELAKELTEKFTKFIVNFLKTDPIPMDKVEVK